MIPFSMFRTKLIALVKYDQKIEFVMPSEDDYKVTETSVNACKGDIKLLNVYSSDSTKSSTLSINISITFLCCRSAVVFSTPTIRDLHH